MKKNIEKNWYLIQCKPKQDFRAFEHLQNQGYQCLLPKQKIEKIRNGQWFQKEEPLFPGYLFIKLDTTQDNWLPIRSTRGVATIVRFGKEPLPVPTNIIERIKYPNEFIQCDFKPGEKVTLNLNNLEGIEAIYLEKDGSERALLLFKILQRELTISTPLQSLRKK